MAHCSATNRSGLPGQRLVHADGDRCTYHRSTISPSLPRRTGSAPLNRSGRPCRRIVRAAGALCTYHQLHVEPVTPSLSFNDGPHPVDHLSPGEREALSCSTACARNTPYPPPPEWAESALADLHHHSPDRDHPS